MRTADDGKKSRQNRREREGGRKKERKKEKKREKERIEEGQELLPNRVVTSPTA